MSFVRAISHTELTMNEPYLDHCRDPHPYVLPLLYLRLPLLLLLGGNAV